MTTRFADAGRKLQARVRNFFDPPLDGDATPLEILHGVLDDLERRIQPVGRGRRIFPCGRVRVRLGPAAAGRDALQAVFDTLRPRFLERLAELGCEPPDPLDVQVILLDRRPPEWPDAQPFAIECGRAGPETPAPPASSGALAITVLKGAATRDRYTFDQPVIRIGRTAEPADDRGRVRRNDVVFLEAVDGTTETVGRAHARLAREPGAREYRIYNESISNPTCVRRDGEAIPVAPRDPRGVRIRPGDEILLGRAVLMIEAAPSAGVSGAESAAPGGLP